MRCAQVPPLYPRVAVNNSLDFNDLPSALARPGPFRMSVIFGGFSMEFMDKESMSAASLGCAQVPPAWPCSVVTNSLDSRDLPSEMAMSFTGFSLEFNDKESARAIKHAAV